LSDIHITRELLRAVARGELSERALAQIETQHLESLCPVCRREIQAWREEGTSEVGYEYALQALPAVLGRHASDLARQMRQAERDLEELLAIPPAERLVRVGRSRSRFRGPVLAERLIQEHKVAVLPGMTFGIEGCYLRIAYGALQKATVAEGMGRLVKGLRAILGP